MAKINWEKLANIEKAHGDAFYLLDSSKFKQNFDELKNAFQANYSKFNIGYSYKTNYTPKLCKIINEKGGFAEVVSEMEYDLAIKLKVNPKKIIVNGPLKSKKEILKFISNKSIVNLDSIKEINETISLAKENPEIIFNFGIRINFNIDDDYTSRFGIDITQEEFKAAIEKTTKIPNMDLKGIHCHFPNRDLESYSKRTREILTISESLFENVPDYIDIGGGFFGKMGESLKAQFSSQVPSYQEYSNCIAKEVSKHYSALSENEKPLLLIEPGNAIVGDTVNFICKIVEIKQIREKAIAISSGSKFNLGSFSSPITLPMNKYSKDVSSKSAPNSIDISGYTCIEGDYLYKNYTQNTEVGDYIEFENVGSYSIVFKPPFIKPNVPVLEILDNGEIEVIKLQENLEDIFKTFIF